MAVLGGEEVGEGGVFAEQVWCFPEESWPGGVVAPGLFEGVGEDGAFIGFFEAG
jgi:hypothetical protein